MSTRKNGKLKRIMALAVNFQLFFSTCAFAKNANKDKNFQTGAEIANAVTQLGGAAMQGMQQMQMQQMQQMQMAQMQTYKVKPVDPTQIPPVLAQNGCMVLEARANHPGDKCEDFDAEKAASGYYTALMSVAEENENDLQNFLTAGHQRFTTQGVGCYEKALKQFTAGLNARIEALNQLEAAIKTEVENFQKLAEKDVLDLKKGNALLEGKPADLIKDMKFEDKFNDPQCRSFMGAEKFKAGGKGGFRGIQDILAKSVEDPSKGMTPSQLKGRQNDIKKEIKEIAKQVSQYASKKKTFKVDPSALGIKSKFVGSKNPALAAILAESSTKAANDLEDLNKEVGKFIETDDAEAKNILAGINSDTVDLDNALFAYERDKKNKCLNNYLQSNFGGANGLIGKLSDPNISDKANRESDSSFKNAITSILNDNEYTMEQKIEELKKMEDKSGNSRYTMMTGKSLNIKGKEIGASTRLRASDMVSIFTDNCSERFEKLRNKQGKSARYVANSLKDYKKKYESIQKKFATQLQEKILADMIDCPNDQTSGKGANSCDGALDMNSSAFCLRTANTCAGNMLACKDKADKIVETTRTEQKVIAQRYKKNMDQFKVRLTQVFAATNKTMEMTARQLDGMYQMGSVYSVPVGVDMSLMTDQLLVEEGIDKSLMLEDPKKYLAKMKENIAELKKSVAKSNEAILNGRPAGEGMSGTDGAGSASKYAGFKGELKKYEDNYKAQEKEWATIAKNCSAMIDQYNGMIAEQNAAAQEDFAKKSKICRQVAAFEERPMGFCGEASSLGDEIFEIATVAGDSTAASKLKEFDKLCDGGNQETGENYNDDSYSPRRSSSVLSMTPKQYCDKYKDDSDIAADCGVIAKAPKLCEDVIGSDDDEERRKKAMESYCKITKKVDSSLNKEFKIVKKAIINGSERCDLADHVEEPNKIGEFEIAELTKDDDSAFKAQADAKKSMVTDVCELKSESKDSKYAKSVATIKKYIAQKQKSDAIANIGDVDVSFCNAQYGGEFGKEMFQMGGEAIGRGLAGGGFAPAGAMQN